MNTNAVVPSFGRPRTHVLGVASGVMSLSRFLPWVAPVGWMIWIYFSWVTVVVGVFWDYLGPLQFLPRARIGGDATDLVGVADVEKAGEARNC